MKLIPQSPAKTLLPAYRVQNVERDKLERFKAELTRLLEHLGHSAQESEEHLKNIVSDFLKAAWYRDEHFVNTKDRQDLVIHNGRTAKDSVGVIIETKKPGNKAEMISPDKPNAKALHELLRYYLNERNRAENKEIRHLIVTDIHTWYLFDAADFERHIYANNKLLKHYTDWAEGRLGAGNTDWFYKEIAAPFFEKELPELRCCTFKLNDYATAATNNDPNDDELLLDLYKILSPEHLLKKPFANDSNALNKQFYDELLYILGLEEVKEGGKKLIERAGKRRHDGSLLENTLSELEVSGTWRDAPGLDQFGDTPEEQRFSIALELCITWLNRILFLKLLEGQLLRWSRTPGDGERLLSTARVKDYDELNELFFHVLAVPEDERRESVQKQFGNVPYLNSSLFEQTELERRTLRISALKDRLEMPVLPNSVLRQSANPPATLQTLAYLFAFLDAYDFSSDAKARIQAENRAVINASVLGLIFEKINGYRDGSFFTPGFITMYMCRETLRRAVLQKFNERYGWDCANLETELHNELIRHKIPLSAAHDLINSLRICDPAVGSGHFLVSALNELIAIKSDLGILCDRQGKLLPLTAVVGNDELILTDPTTDQPIEYRPGNTASQRIQETLFHEKQTLIENCLFGVDINPKSVMICRLRLWIELLKHAYFKTVDGGRSTVDGGGRRLETLPNIDINIKTGNSLISRFALDEDLKEVFAKGKIKANDYRLAVAAYKNASDKAAKAGLLEQIGRVKSAIYESFYLNNPLNKKLKKLLGDRFLIENKAVVGDLFEKLKSQDISDDLNKINREVAALETQIEELKQGKTFRNSFEWRFEFPEVLDDEGTFVGFDVVVGNPPYIPGKSLIESDKYFLKINYEYTQGKYDLYIAFIERALKVLSEKRILSFIVPNTIFTNENAKILRRNLCFQGLIQSMVVLDDKVFDEAHVESAIVNINNLKARTSLSILDKNFEKFYDVKYSEILDDKFNRILISKNEVDDLIIQKIAKKSIRLGDISDICIGIQVGGEGDSKDFKEKYISINKTSEDYKPILDGKDFEPFSVKWPGKYILYGDWLHRKRDEKYFLNSKIIIRQIGLTPICTVDLGGYYTLNTIYNAILINEDFNILYTFAIVNSKLIKYVWKKLFHDGKTLFPKIKKSQLVEIPIAKAGFEDQQPIISLVTRILAAKQSDPQADTGALEAEVDGLVYGLYGLGEEEIKIVEGVQS